MATHYLMKYKGTYRVLPEYDKDTNDFPRDRKGNIAEGYDDLYIPCRNGARIMHFGHENDNKTKVWLTAYIPSVNKGNKVMKQLRDEGVQMRRVYVLDGEILFNFPARNISNVADKLHAVVKGANISPMSTKNLPKSDIEIPDDLMREYKDAIKDVNKNEYLAIKDITSRFLSNILQRNTRKTDKSFDVFADMRRLCMARQPKEYIYQKGFWEQYIKYLKKGLKG